MQATKSRGLRVNLSGVVGMDSGATNTAVERGRVLASVLHGSWRLAPQPCELTASELAGVAPLLLETGAGALGWRRVRDSEAGASGAARPLHEAYRFHTLQAAVHEREIVHALTVLRNAGVEPVIAKGWAAARYYPEPGLRPHGDIDLCVGTEFYDVADAALQATGVQKVPVDLHTLFPELDDRGFTETFQRSIPVNIGGDEIRVLGHEDHLRFLCLHQLRHGAWRALWLCDIGAVLENIPADFDWDYFVGGDSRRSAWAVCVLGLAHHLLGASLDNVPAALRAEALPSWIAPAVLEQWGKGHAHYGRRMEAYFRKPAGVVKAVRSHWPNAVQTGLRMRRPHDKSPALPFQVGDFLARTAAFAMRASHVR